MRMDIRPLRTEADYDWALSEIEEYFRTVRLLIRRGPLGSTCWQRSLRSMSGGIGLSIRQTPALPSALGWSKPGLLKATWPGCWDRARGRRKFSPGDVG